MSLIPISIYCTFAEFKIHLNSHRTLPLYNTNTSKSLKATLKTNSELVSESFTQNVLHQ